jgi:hypothetical protein
MCGEGESNFDVPVVGGVAGLVMLVSMFVGVVFAARVTLLPLFDRCFRAI